ncbi:hypothetical protein T05_13646 [Trichinella murrelli]|uniref:Uncharacterized protein n=1 Tax=Trichinella murrelli TaxID=144512 RepID=A0A0V0U545_9BILA|nr:hypothetical protein T05_13646 [Trichinella murrelli]
MLCESKIRLEEDDLLKMVNNCGKLFLYFTFLHLPELLVQVVFQLFQFEFFTFSRFAEAFMDVNVMNESSKQRESSMILMLFVGN